MKLLVLFFALTVIVPVPNVFYQELVIRGKWKKFSDGEKRAYSKLMFAGLNKAIHCNLRNTLPIKFNHTK